MTNVTNVVMGGAFLKEIPAYAGSATASIRLTIDPRDNRDAILTLENRLDGRTAAITTSYALSILLFHVHRTVFRIFFTKIDVFLRND